MTHDSLAAALVAFQAEKPTVHKGQTATVPTKAGGSYTYKYADLADVDAAITPLLARHGLSFTCLPRQTTAGGYELVGMLRHVSGEHDEGSLPLYGAKAQELGSAITYARRYLLGAMTGVVTDDDDDGHRANTARPTTIDRGPEARDLWRRAQSAADIADLRRVWTAAHSRGLLDVEVPDHEGTLEPLGDLLRRHGDTLQALDSHRSPPAGGTGDAAPTPQEAAASPTQQSRANASIPDGMTRAQQRMMMSLFGGSVGLAAHADRETRLGYVSRIAGRTVLSTNDLTRDEASRVIDVLKQVGSRDDLDALLDSMEGGDDAGDHQ